MLTALALTVALSGCAGDPTSSSSAAEPSASSPTASPSSPHSIPTARSSSPSDGSSRSALDPDDTEGRDLTIADFFMVDDDMTEDLYDVATLKGQKAIGGELSYGEAVLELRLANLYRSLSFSAGQANDSRSSDNVLRIEIHRNGASDQLVDIAFNEVKPIEVDVSNVNALKIVMKCQTRRGDSCSFDRSITGVVYGLRLKA